MGVATSARDGTSELIRLPIGSGAGPERRWLLVAWEVNSNEFEALEMLNGWLVDRRDLDFSYHPTNKVNRYFMREKRGREKAKGLGTWVHTFLVPGYGHL